MTGNRWAAVEARAARREAWRQHAMREARDTPRACVARHLAAGLVADRGPGPADDPSRLLEADAMLTATLERG